MKHVGLQSCVPPPMRAVPRAQLEHVYSHIARRDAAASVNAAWLRGLRSAGMAAAKPCAVLEAGAAHPTPPAPAQEPPRVPLAQTGEHPEPAAPAAPKDTASCGDQARSQ